MDGEWRGPDAGQAKREVRLVGTAPLPGARRPGRHRTAGAISPAPSSASPHSSKHQNAAWELVKFLTTDTDAVVAFANAIHNVPST